MKASGGREVGEVVLQEGEVAVDEAACIEPRQAHGFVLHRQLPRPAVQAIDSCGNHGNTVMPQSYLQFQGLPELMKIPLDNSPTDGYRFHFQLSNVNKDNNQDHIQKDVSSYYPLQPSCLHLMQENEMECTAVYSELLMQVRKSQADKESYNKWKYIRPCRAKRMPIRKAPQVIPDPVPERKRTAPVNLAYTVRKSRVPNSVHTRPYRERVIHLLALKDYKKHELLVRLQRDGMTAEDKDSLGKLLQEVAHLNTRDRSYSLKNCVFKELQRDWPGYNELDRQALELVLARKVHPLFKVTGTDHPQFSIDSSTDEIFCPSQEQLYNSADIDYSKNKKVRISHLTTKQQPASSDCLNNTSEIPAMGHPPYSESTTSLSSPSLPNIHLPTSNYLQPVYSKCSYSSITEGRETQDPHVDRFSQSSRIFECQQGKHSLQTLTSISVTMKYPKHMEKQHSLTGEKFKYKFTEYKTKSKDYSIKILEKQQTESERQDEGAKPNSSEEVAKVCTPTGKSCSTSELPDYLTSYVTIISSEQRERYEQEFRVDYEEYKALHEKLLPFSKIFVFLTSQKEQFPPDSREYEDINKKISLEYQKMKQMNHNYFEEKLRCQYLYNKLAHIKDLINSYDQQ